ncbi:hypothetical protein KP77_26980 [Jeotgalibacillus alimentarius]|uniref:Uncharacterized protein n=1 Tax=Jeotgalibacillus alimentarius TaxID=135826 RepID=A0A0C2VQ68_9BACL|nr:hypothetical protein KP77_26980 [Jeotgalibacillus alimentarius]
MIVQYIPKKYILIQKYTVLYFVTFYRFNLYPFLIDTDLWNKKIRE